MQAVDRHHVVDVPGLGRTQLVVERRELALGVGLRDHLDSRGSATVRPIWSLLLARHLDDRLPASVYEEFPRW